MAQAVFAAFGASECRLGNCRRLDEALRVVLSGSELPNPITGGELGASTLGTTLAHSVPMTRIEVGFVWCCSAVLLVSSAAFQARAFGVLLAETLFPIRAPDILGQHPARQTEVMNQVPEPPLRVPAQKHEAMSSVDRKTGTEPVAEVDPLHAKSCPNVRLTIVTELHGDEGSVVHIRGPGEDRAMRRAVGDRFGSYTVAHIGFNSLRIAPSVWLLDERGLCQVLLFQSARSAPAEGPGSGVVPRHVAIAEHIRAKIEKVDTGRFRVDRSVIDDVLASPADSLSGARVVRSLKGSKGAGLRLSGVEPGSLLDYLGLRTGDRLEAVDDWVLSNPETVLRAYAATRTASAVSVRISRDGRQHLIRLELY